MYNLNEYIKNHPERIVEGTIKRDGFDRWGVYDNRFQRHFHFTFGDSFLINRDDTEPLQCEFKGHEWHEGKYEADNQLFSLDDNEKAEAGEYTGKLFRRVKDELFEYLEEFGIKEEVVTHVLAKLEELGFSIFDCVDASTNYSNDMFTINVKGCNFLTFQNEEEERRCLLQHFYVYDDHFNEENPSIDRFIFTTNTGDTFEYVYLHEVDQFQNFNESYLQFSKTTKVFQTEDENWFIEEPDSPIDYDIEEKEYIISYSSETPFRGSISTGIDFILLGTNKGSVTQYDHQNATNKIVIVRDEVERIKIRDTDYETIAIRGIFLDKINNKAKIYLDYIVDEELDSPTCTEYELIKAFKNNPQFLKTGLTQYEVCFDLKIYKGINMDPFDDSWLIDDEYYERVREGFSH